MSKREQLQQFFNDLPLSGRCPSQLEAILAHALTWDHSTPEESIVFVTPHCLLKGINDWRPCGDYRCFNQVTTADQYPFPHSDHTTSDMHDKTMLSDIDLLWAYHQIPVRKDKFSRAAITSPFRFFEHLLMLYGLRNTAQTFQSPLGGVLHSLDFVHPYTVDILIASFSLREHRTHLFQSFLISVGSVVIEHRWHHVNSTGVQPLAVSVAVVGDFPQPPSCTPNRWYVEEVQNALAEALSRVQLAIASFDSPVYFVHMTELQASDLDTDEDKVSMSTQQITHQEVLPLHDFSTGSRKLKKLWSTVSDAPTKYHVQESRQIYF
ncbi:uncharacterized protein DEA37_0007241 [Paragonimus westermani]|uniref:Reverse transcriptase domain-containing protein n=1 Tax=Paragonimus westermani TaxID=34504 RepID=A0A5J4N5P4_9TREM|nr:uncharacterized protein DEA37_0007241 [Paragonimus westermani]